MKYTKKEVLLLMEKSFNAGYNKKDIVDAGLEAKEANFEVNWILLKHVKVKKKD